MVDADGVEAAKDRGISFPLAVVVVGEEFFSQVEFEIFRITISTLKKYVILHK